MVFRSYPQGALASKFLCRRARAYYADTVDQRGLGKAMKHSPLWFATPLAWTLVLLGATVFAIFA